MKISKLIEKLENQKEQLGDVETWMLRKDECGDFYETTIEDVFMRKGKLIIDWRC